MLYYNNKFINKENININEKNNKIYCFKEL